MCSTKIKFYNRVSTCILCACTKRIKYTCCYSRSSTSTSCTTRRVATILKCTIFRKI
uniref:Uncharacterized protein n=1 Tax=uncultured marine virus TaxID=186617 RepID=A0A0F7L9E8_9VIRU|nr:hypothetical protein [uncultured marine virus]